VFCHYQKFADFWFKGTLSGFILMVTNHMKLFDWAFTCTENTKFQNLRKESARYSILLR